MAGNLYLPELQKQVINDLLSQSDIIWLWLGITLAVWGAVTFFNGLSVFLSGRCVLQVHTEMKTRFARRLFELPQEFFLRHGSGYLTARLELDTAGCSWFYSLEYFQGYLAGIGILGAMVILAWMTPLIFPFVLIALLLQLVILRNYLKRNYALSKQSCELTAENYGTLHQYFCNIRTLKAQTREHAASSQMAEAYDKTKRLGFRLLNLEISGRFWLHLLPLVTRAGVLAAGIMLFRTGQWSAGEIWAALSYVSLSFAPAMTLCSNLMNRASALAALERVEELYAMLPEENLEQGITPEPLHQIAFKNISFGYQSKQVVLNQLSFEATSGDMVAVVGPSGSGKSTLMSLLLLLFRPQSGEILFNGISAARYNLKQLRQRIGYVCQSPQFFDGTLAENLSPDALRSEMIASLKAVGADLLVDRLPEKILERGENFSAGERIRIAIARELLRHTDVLILDEPTANLDENNRALLMKTLSAPFFSNKIIFLVTHDKQLRNDCGRSIEIVPPGKGLYANR